MLKLGPVPWKVDVDIHPGLILHHVGESDPVEQAPEFGRLEKTYWSKLRNSDGPSLQEQPRIGFRGRRNTHPSQQIRNSQRSHRPPDPGRDGGDHRASRWGPLHLPGESGHRLASLRFCCAANVVTASVAREHYVYRDSSDRLILPRRTYRPHRAATATREVRCCTPEAIYTSARS